MKITVETVLHDEQRYRTVGDWEFKPDGELTIKVSQLGDFRYNFLVGIHELIEAVLCQHDGVAEKDVCEFDIEFEKNRSEGNMDEPGMESAAPYNRQHRIADAIERMLAVHLEVDWSAYDKAVNSL